MKFSLCGLNNRNTGAVLCDVSRGALVAPFIFNGEFTPEDCEDSDTFFAALQAANKLSKNDPGKIFPIGNVQELTNKSEANKEGTLGYGFKAVIFEGRPAYEFKIFADAMQLAALRFWNGKTLGIMEYDTNSNAWLAKSGLNLKGFQAKLFFTGNQLATLQNIEEGVVTGTVSILDVKEYIDHARYNPLGENSIADINGLLDAEMYVTAANTTNVWHLGVKKDSTQYNKPINFYEKFPTSLFVGGNFAAFTGATFSTSLAFTTVAADATNKGGTFTFDSTAYTALDAGTRIKIVPLLPDDLDAADVPGLEIEPFFITK